MPNRTGIASHRGGALLWPENSLLAFRRALALPAEQLELDVHLSADDEVVVIHDATLDRTTDASGEVRAWTAEALRGRRLKATGGEPIPMLSEVAAMTRAAGRVLRLEIKADRRGRPYPGIVGRCLAVLDALGMRERTVVMSFQPATVAETSAAGGFLERVLLLEGPTWRGAGPACSIALARACGATEIGLGLGEWDAAAVGAMREAGLGASAWGVDTAEQVRHAFALGLDAIASDDPELALKVRDGTAG